MINEILPKQPTHHENETIPPGSPPVCRSSPGGRRFGGDFQLYKPGEPTVTATLTGGWVPWNGVIPPTDLSIIDGTSNYINDSGTKNPEQQTTQYQQHDDENETHDPDPRGADRVRSIRTGGALA